MEFSAFTVRRWKHRIMSWQHEHRICRYWIKSLTLIIALIIMQPHWFVLIWRYEVISILSAHSLRLGNPAVLSSDCCPWNRLQKQAFANKSTRNISSTCVWMPSAAKSVHTFNTLNPHNASNICILFSHSMSVWTQRSVILYY